MRQSKYIFPAFSFYDRTGIRQFLEKKAQQGWLLEKMGGFAWKFRRIEPKRIHYAVTYFPTASAFDPEPSEQQEVFREFCAHSGWVLAASSAQLQIFYNEAENPVPIETDPAIELENIHKTAKKSYLPTYFLLFLVAFMPWLTMSTAWKYFPIDVLSNNIYYFNALSSAVLLLLCATELIGYFRWRSKARKAAEDGEFVETRGNRTFQIVLVSILMAALVALLLSMADTKMAVTLIALMVLVSAISAVAIGARGLMKQMKLPAKTNRYLTIMLIVVLSFGVATLGTWGILSAMDEWWPEDSNLMTIEHEGATYEVYREDIPLTVEDLMEVDYEGYSYHWSSSRESLLVGQHHAYQLPRLDGLDAPSLQYTIVEVKADFLYDFCLNTMLEDNRDAWSEDIYGNITYDEYRQVDAVPWGADAAYREYNGENAHDQYLLCYGDHIIELDSDWELTDEQKAIVGVIFG